jgi:segregation and condensation protein B
MNRAPTLDETSPPPPERIVEALLFVGGAPLSVTRACEAVRGLTPGGLAEAVAALNRAYRRQNRPYRIQLRERGYEMVLRPAFRAVRDRLLGPGQQVRLSQPALDTLALVAYRQPVTRQEVDALRGADSLALLRQLVRVGLVAVQRGDSSQKEVSYGTTTRFLRELGLRNLDDLPRIQDLQRL